MGYTDTRITVKEIYGETWSILKEDSLWSQFIAYKNVPNLEFLLIFMTPTLFFTDF